VRAILYDGFQPVVVRDEEMCLLYIPEFAQTQKLKRSMRSSTSVRWASASSVETGGNVCARF
jgi:hypothetical protein